MCKNLSAAKRLIETYRSISIETLEKCFKELGADGLGGSVMETLTGFGRTDTCSLCQDTTCNKCIWCPPTKEDYNYLLCPCVEHVTFNQIRYADTPKSLKAALLARADILEELYENSRKRFCIGID